MLKACALLAGCLLALAGLALWYGRVVAPGIRALRTEGAIRSAEAILTTVAVLALVLGAWFVLGVFLDVLAVVPGPFGRRIRRIAAWLTPRLARRLVAAALGLGASTMALPAHSLAAAVAAVASPSPGPAPHWEARAEAGSAPAPPATSRPETTGHPWAAGHPGATARPAPGHAASGTDDLLRTGAWVAEPPRVRPQPAATHLVTGPPWPAEGAAAVVVQRGDTLWGIAASRLGPGATQAEIAELWPRWYAANRRVIGDDPDLLLPGQVLTAPGPDGRSGR